MDFEYPTYWKNCQKYILENGETSGVIRSLKVVDGKVISAGTKSYFPGTPCIWVGDEPFVLEENDVKVWDMLIWINNFTQNYNLQELAPKKR